MFGRLVSGVQTRALLRGIGSVVDLWPVLPSKPRRNGPETESERIRAVQSRFRAASLAVFGHGLDWESIAEAAGSPASGVRALAVRQLARASKSADQGSASIEILCALARDPDTGVRHAAIDALASHGEAAVGPLSTLLANDEAEAVRLAALDALKRMGRDSVPALLAVAQGPASGLRQTAVRALGEIGHASAKVLACLRTCLGDTDLYVRARAAYALGALRSSDVESVLALRTALEDTDKIVRDGAIHALGEIGPPAQMALAALRSLRARDASAADRIDNAIDMIIGASRR